MSILKFLKFKYKMDTFFSSSSLHQNCNNIKTIKTPKNVVTTSEHNHISLYWTLVNFWIKIFWSYLHISKRFKTDTYSGTIYN